MASLEEPFEAPLFYTPLECIKNLLCNGQFNHGIDDSIDDFMILV